MRRIGNLAPLASFLTILAMLLAACGSTTGGGASTPTTCKSSVKVALVTDIGGLNDRSFNQLAYAGYKKAEAQYCFTEKVIQTQSQNDYVKNLTLAAKSANLVVAVGFLMQVPLDQVAKTYPNVKFAIVDGCATLTIGGNCDPLSNVAQLFFKEQEAGCLVGAVAGQMELDGKAKIPKLLGKSTIGAVGGIEVPAVDRYIAGYKFCAKKVDPSVKVYVNFSQSFTDTAKCKDVALSQINQHQADIIFQVAGGCGVGALDAADSKGVFGIGVDADQGYLHSSIITSAIKRVDSAVYDIVKDVEDSTYANFVANPTTFDLAHDGVGYATPSSDVPADAKMTAESYKQQILAGSLIPPDCSKPTNCIPTPGTP